MQDDEQSLRLLTGIFGEIDGKSPVSAISRDQAEMATLRLVTRAKEDIFQVTVHSSYFQTISESLRSKEVRKRILLLGDEKETQGIRALRASQFDQAFTSSFLMFDKQYQQWNEVSKGSTDLAIRIYFTVPWIRGTITDAREAVFLLAPTLRFGRNAVYFYTHDESAVETINSVFEDIWSDPRTKEFVPWYEGTWLKGRETELASITPEVRKAFYDALEGGARREPEA